MIKNVKFRNSRSIVTILNIIFLVVIFLGVCYRLFGYSFENKSNFENKPDLMSNPQPTYMIYYEELDDSIIEMAQKYDIVILHPKSGDLTREDIKKIQDGGTCVLGYISIGEDLRTAGMTPEQMLEDSRFIGDATGPRVGPEDSFVDGLDDTELQGETSPSGGGFASYYLDDNDYDGKPDFNPNFNCAYTNIGDPLWFDVLDNMTLDGVDKVAGMKEILTEDYGRGLGCDGLFLDTIDTCAPNGYTSDSDPARTRFEWTSPGVKKFMERVKREYSDVYLLQNRGLFFYNYQHPHYQYNPRQHIDFLMYESYRLDSNTTSLYYESFFLDNKNMYAPKIMAEANRPDGFKVLSLDYAEGPEKYQLKDTLLGKSNVGLDILMEDINEAQSVGFSHYITDGGVTMVNDFVLQHSEEKDIDPPIWSSVHNKSVSYPPQEPIPRVGIGQVEAIENGVIVRWDVAMDKSGVTYTLYYQKSPFDFEMEPNLETAQKVELVPEVGEGYTYQAEENTYPYQAVIEGLDAGSNYYFLIRAKDRSTYGNEEKNTVVLTESPLERVN